MLAIWSAASTSVVLAVLIFMVLEPGLTVNSIGIEVLIALFALEALARRQLARFVGLVAAFLLVAAVALVVATQLIDDWRLVVAVLLGLAAAALLFLNVRELLRD